jgi:competence protein ComFC
MRVISDFIDFLLPHRCPLCSEYINSVDEFCSSCWKNFTFTTKPYCEKCGMVFDFELEEKAICGACIRSSPDFDLARHLFIFDQYSKKSIHNFKFNDKTHLSVIYAKLLFNRYKLEIDEYDLIVPTPMYWLKKIFRMYNQAQLLGYYLSKISAKPLFYGLKKVKWTKAQLKLSARAREKNLSGSIKVTDKSKIEGKKIILIDDVYTTGSTANTCSRILKSAGAKKVLLLTVAKTKI